LHEKSLQAGADAFTTKSQLSAHPVETIESLLVGSAAKTNCPSPTAQFVPAEPSSTSSASAKLFAGLPRTALQELFKIARPVTLLPGERCEVRRSRKMAVLLSGAAALYFNDRMIASAQPWRLHRNYSFFLAKSKPFTFVCEAQTDSRLYKFEKKALKHYFLLRTKISACSLWPHGHPAFRTTGAEPGARPDCAAAGGAGRRQPVG
jgi:hypothetical protein